MYIAKATLNKKIFTVLLLINIFFGSLTLIAQSKSPVAKDSAKHHVPRKDIVDVIMKVLHKDRKVDTTKAENRRTHISPAPLLEYTIANGFAYGLYGIAGFELDTAGNSNTSSIVAEIKYTQHSQFLLPVQWSIWTKNNEYNYVGDWRYLNYPQETYGLGSSSGSANGYLVNYKYIRAYQFVLKKVLPNFHIGFGYQFDYHWDIKEVNIPAGTTTTDFEKYGYRPTSLLSGIALNILYDSRKNSISPEGGSFYGNIIFRQNAAFLGSNTNSSSAIIDVRKYIKIQPHGVLAFWSYNVFTVSGDPPYLDLPETGSDTYNNTGRGYAQGRFIGKNMIDLEAEYRYRITRNGLFGGVVFANAESLSGLNNNKFEAVEPAVGAGLRIKFNKFSRTNICIDYGVGVNGSRGFFGNLGEVF